MTMNRRDFLGLLGRVALGTALTGYSNSAEIGISSSSINIKLADETYEINGGVLRQISGNKRNKLGVLADIHAHVDNTNFFINQMRREGASIYVTPGDLSYSLRDIQGARNDFNEIVEVGESIASTGKLFLAFPGNHEQKLTYDRAINHLSFRYSNVVDMVRVPVADFDDFTIVALGGVGDARFCIPQGYVVSPQDFDRFSTLIKDNQGDKPLVVCTHSPMFYSTKRGLDVIDRGNINVGEKSLTRIRTALNCRFAISGHIHEAHGMINSKEEPVNVGEFSESLDFNPGAVWDHLKRPNLRPAAGIMEFNGRKAKAYILNR